MIARGFKSVIWVATVGSAALACYMVSLQVATERAELEKVERQIVAAKQDIRSLQTELGTRGRLSQLEHWNAEVLALSAPTSAQFMSNEFTLARLDRREPTFADEMSKVHMAALETAPAKSAAAAAPAIVPADAADPASSADQPLVRHASYIPEAAPAKPAEAAPAKAKAEVAAKPKIEVAGKPKTDSAVKPKADSAAKPKTAAKAVTAKGEALRSPRLGGLASEIGTAARREKAGGGN